MIKLFIMFVVLGTLNAGIIEGIYKVKRYRCEKLVIALPSGVKTSFCNKSLKEQVAEKLFIEKIFDNEDTIKIVHLCNNDLISDTIFFKLNDSAKSDFEKNNKVKLTEGLVFNEYVIFSPLKEKCKYRHIVQMLAKQKGEVYFAIINQTQFENNRVPTKSNLDPLLNELK